MSIVSAEQGCVQVLLSGGLSRGRMIEGVKTNNPFCSEAGSQTRKTAQALTSSAGGWGLRRFACQRIAGAVGL